jgi:diguanylate cyclase (GGDEF)-like protein
MDHSPDGMVFVDSKNRVRFWNRGAQQVIGISSAEFADHDLVQSCVSLEPTRLEKLRADLTQHITDTIPVAAAGNKETLVERVIQCVVVQGEPWLFVTLKNCLTPTQSESELHRLAQTDPLSDLLNRRGFQATLEEHLDQQLALAIVDVDFFKRINDQRGHETGDRAIQWIAKKLSDSFPQAVAIGRLGGDEFGVVLEFTAQLEIARWFSEFCESVEFDPIGWYPAGMTISIGVAISKSGGVSARELLTTADRAMYQSKREGRNRVTTVAV